MLDTINISIKKRQAFELQYWKGTFLLTSVLGPVSVNYMSKMLCHLLPDGLALIFKRLVQILLGRMPVSVKSVKPLGLYIWSNDNISPREDKELDRNYRMW